MRGGSRFRPVRKMTLAELRREQDVVSAWIRDVNAPKRARLADIAAEMERRARKGRAKRKSRKRP